VNHEVFEQYLDKLHASDDFVSSDAESIVELERDKNRLEAAVCKKVAAFDEGGEWKASGAKSAPMWMAVRCHLSLREARRQIRRGRHLSQLPFFSCAWDKGLISGDHLDAVISVLSPIAEEAFARDEEMLLEHAQNLEFRHFAALMASWALLADPDGAEEVDMKRRARRDAYLVETIDGMWVGRLILDPVSGEALRNALDPICEQMFQEDWAKAKAELGREPTLFELCRTPGQRRCDAWVEMATRSRSVPEGARRPEPLISFLVNYDLAKGPLMQLAKSRQEVAPGTLLDYLDEANFERVVFGPGNRAECSVTARFFSGATRRILEVRDQECCHGYCDEPSAYCQADHILEYSKGGLTTQENGRMMCPTHNMGRNNDPPLVE